MAKPSTYKRALGTSQHTNTSAKNSRRFMESLEGAHEKFIARIANVQVSKQPYVMKYVLEALLEDACELYPELNAKVILRIDKVLFFVYIEYILI